MRLNYPELFQNIKMSIFTGDHSAIYSLACSIACLAAMISLLWWYNKMLNDPFGRLDVRSIIRSGIILFLTCNFYSFVLVPFDSLTHWVTKAITASVDNDTSGITGKINEALADVERSRSENTLAGELSQEMSRTSSSETDSGLSGETSGVLEAVTEVAVDGGRKTSWWQNAWTAIKTAISMKIGQVVENAGTAISWILSFLVKLVQWVLMGISSIYLIILGLIGPFVFALALMPGYVNNISTWVARYIQISFWVPMAAIVDYVNFKLKDAMLAAFWTASNTAQLAFPLHLIVMDVVTLICLLAVPQMASWIISGSGASDVNRGIATTAQKGAMLLGKFK
jgi:hypothetical protein